MGGLKMLSQWTVPVIFLLLGITSASFFDLTPSTNEINPGDGQTGLGFDASAAGSLSKHVDIDTPNLNLLDKQKDKIIFKKPLPTPTPTPPPPAPPQVYQPPPPVYRQPPPPPHGRPCKRDANGQPIPPEQAEQGKGHDAEKDDKDDDDDEKDQGRRAVSQVDSLAEDFKDFLKQNNIKVNLTKQDEDLLAQFKKHQQEKLAQKQARRVIDQPPQLQQVDHPLKHNATESHDKVARDTPGMHQMGGSMQGMQGGMNMGGGMQGMNMGGGMQGNMGGGMQGGHMMGMRAVPESHQQGMGMGGMQQMGGGMMQPGMGMGMQGMGGGMQPMGGHMMGMRSAPEPQHQTLNAPQPHPNATASEEDRAARNAPNPPSVQQQTVDPSKHNATDGHDHTNDKLAREVPGGMQGGMNMGGGMQGMNMGGGMQGMGMGGGMQGGHMMGMRSAPEPQHQPLNATPAESHNIQTRSHHLPNATNATAPAEKHQLHARSAPEHPSGVPSPSTNATAEDPHQLQFRSEPEAAAAANKTQNATHPDPAAQHNLHTRSAPPHPPGSPHQVYQGHPGQHPMRPDENADQDINKRAINPKFGGMMDRVMDYFNN